MPTCSFEPTHDLAEFRSAPVGRCHVGRSFVLWSAAPDLCGAMQWDAIDDTSIADTCAILELLDRPHCTVVIDWRAITCIAAEALLAVTARVHARASTPVLLLPPGLPGILLAGLAQAVAAAAPAIAPDDGDPIVARAHPLATGALAAAAERAREARAGSELLGRVREELRRDLVATLADCAGRLDCSPRTLQRALEAHGTRFSGEQRRARVLAATELLVYTDIKIDAIAARTGFGLSSRLSAALRRDMGVTAGELRARARRAYATQAQPCG